MKILSVQSLLPLAALLALGACADTIPTRSRAVATTEPTVSAAPAATTTTTVVTTAPASSPYASPFAGSTAQTSSSTTTTTTTVLTSTQLSANEAVTLLSGNTATGMASNGQTYFMLFRNDRQLRFRENQYRDRGDWHVALDGQLCTTLRVVDVGVENCYALYRNGNTIDFGGRDGNRLGTFSVLQGDPQNIVNL
jgi:hypothetical protein